MEDQSARRATASHFANWVFDQTTGGRHRPKSALQRATRRERMRLGAVSHRDIELFLMQTWAQDWLGPKNRSRWSLWFADRKEGPPRTFTASRLIVAGIPLRCVPDVVLQEERTGEVLIIERKTTTVPEPRIPTNGWPNVETQLWCYSWIDEFADAPDVRLVGQLWCWNKWSRVLCHRHPAWWRSDTEHEERCRRWFERYGGIIDDK